MKRPFHAIDRGAARRRFERAAHTYSKAARLEQEVARRMLERLAYVRIAPRRVLDAGSGPPRRDLGKRYPGAQLVALDFALGMLRRPSWFSRKPLAVCGDLERLPLAADSVDLVWCNMALHWLSDPLPAFNEFARVLAPGGLLMFSTLGPDTLKELRAAAGQARVHAFTDMHDLGDMLVAGGFNAPVMDMEMIEIDYRKGSLLADLRGTGQTNALAQRTRGLTGKRFEMPTRATFEVVYGHAWNGTKNSGPSNQEPKTVRIFKRMP